MVHGNLKPSNVLFAADGIPRVVDFRPPVGLFQITLPADDDEPAGLVLSGPRTDRRPDRGSRARTRTFTGSRDPLRIADRPTAIQRSDRGRSARAGSFARSRPSIAVQSRRDAGHRRLLPPVLAKEPVAALLTVHTTCSSDCRDSRTIRRAASIDRRDSYFPNTAGADDSACRASWPV